MPFVGLDWRSPGDMWLKTANGWERAKLMRLRLLENLSENLIERVLARSNSDSAIFEHSVLPSVADRSWWNEDSKCSARQPRILMPQTTKENLCKPSLCDAMTYLEMKAALGDVRRYDYVVGVIDTLISDCLSTLSGASQKLLFELVRKMMTIVLRTRCNVSVARRVLNTLEKRLDDVRYTQIGTQRSWSDRYAELQKMKADLAALTFGDRDGEFQSQIDAFESAYEVNSKRQRRSTKSFTLDTENLRESERSVEKRRSASKRSRCDSLGRPGDAARLNLLDLPVECTMKIVHCLANETDMVNLGRMPSRLFRVLVLDERLWRDICYFHYEQSLVRLVFEKQAAENATASAGDCTSVGQSTMPCESLTHRTAQLNRIRSISECGPTSTTEGAKLQLFSDADNHSNQANVQCDEGEPDCTVLSVSTMRKRLTNVLWYRVFRTLQRTCTPRTLYPSGMLVHCLRCNLIYWNCVGHPCVAPASEHDAERDAVEPVVPAAPIPISPERFVRIFI